MEANYKIIVHGGAWDIPKEHHKAHEEGVEKAALIGLDTLKKGSSAIDACIAAVKSMENDPTFDAGKGSFLNLNGEVEMDAIVMDGTDLSIGSVAGIQCVKNPIEVANKVRLNSEHCLLVGKGAEKFAKRENAKLASVEDLLVGRELERYKALLEKGEISARQFFDKPSKMGTVGAVAIDKEGRIACATSTGGTPNKLPGRVGDSPIPGAGAYANKVAGVSTTGWGESIMKVLLAKTAVDFAKVLKGQEAGDAAIEALNEINGLGGLIMINQEGEASYSYNTPYMARAMADTHGLHYATVDQQ